MTVLVDKAKWIFLFFSTLLFSSSCSVSPDSDSPPENSIQTDKSSYSAEIDRIFGVFWVTNKFEVEVRLQNTTDEVVYIPYLTAPCRMPLYELHSMVSAPGGFSAFTQIRAHTVDENLCQESAIALEPEENRVDTILISGPNSWESGTNIFLGKTEGQFRLISAAGTCTEEVTNSISRVAPECRLPDSLSSAPFEVILDNGPELPQTELIQTDLISYVAEPLDVEPGAHPIYGFDAIARFENTTEETIYLSRCGEQPPVHGTSYIGPENLDFETSAYHLTPIPERSQDCISNPITLQPGATRTDTLFIQGPGYGARSAGGSPTGKMEGEFVLKYVAGLCLHPQENGIEIVGCFVAPENLPRSNTFEIKLEEDAIR